MAEAAAHEHHEHPPYVKIWGILVVLLIISVLGPMFEIQAITLITAFGIAIVKAYLVVKNFMHINVEPRFIAYLMGTMLIFVFLFFTAVAPDVMKYEGVNWVKQKVVQADPGAAHAVDPGASGDGHH
jgi:caa(3)-type oxidase subunit IV